MQPTSRLSFHSPAVLYPKCFCPFLLTIYLGRAKTQAGWVRTQARTCGICDGQSCTRISFLLVLWLPLLIIISQTAPLLLWTGAGKLGPILAAYQTHSASSHPTNKNPSIFHPCFYPAIQSSVCLSAFPSIHPSIHPAASLSAETSDKSTEIFFCCFLLSGQGNFW